MSDESLAKDGLTHRQVSRRSLIKAGAIVGGSVWVAPVIDSFTSRAAAASSSFSYSFVALIYTCDNTTYRQKWTGQSGPGSLSSDCDSTWTFADCKNTFQQGGSFAPSGCPATAVQNGDGSVTITLNCSTTATVSEYGYHMGHCCYESAACDPSAYYSPGTGTVTFKTGAPNKSADCETCS